LKAILKRNSLEISMEMTIVEALSLGGDQRGIFEYFDHR
jgi:hypothetical protein